MWTGDRCLWEIADAALVCATIRGTDEYLECTSYYVALSRSNLYVEGKGNLMSSLLLVSRTREGDKLG